MCVAFVRCSLFEESLFESIKALQEICTFFNKTDCKALKMNIFTMPNGRCPWTPDYSTIQKLIEFYYSFIFSDYRYKRYIESV